MSLSGLVLFLFVSSLLGLRSSVATELRDRETSSTFSTFVYTTSHGDLTFALSAVSSGNDLFLHLSAPSTYQWISVGTGNGMSGSVMWVLYTSPTKDGLTLSPRLSNDNVEPSFSSKINCELVEGSSYHNGVIAKSNSHYYSANVHCKNITTLGSGEGKLDFSKTRQPFIYAWGPARKPLSSTQQTASLQRHDSYGTFWMDLTKAISVETSVPSGSALSATINAGANEQAESDGDKVGPAHAVLMCGAFLIIFPLGAVLLRFLESVKIHGIVQGMGVLAALLGVGIGLYLSKMYNHSKGISSGHQIFGILLLVLVFAQWGIGFYHHLCYRKYERPTIYGKVHLYAGPAVVLGGIVNGFTGFNFARESRSNIFYGIAVVIVSSAVLALLGWKAWSKKRQTRGELVGDGTGELNELKLITKPYNTR